MQKRTTAIYVFVSDTDLNTFHEAGVLANFTKLSKNINIMEFHDHIWNHRAERIQISTNMPGIGSLIHEIDVQI